MRWTTRSNDPPADGDRPDDERAADEALVADTVRRVARAALVGLDAALAELSAGGGRPDRMTAAALGIRRVVVELHEGLGPIDGSVPPSSERAGGAKEGAEASSPPSSQSTTGPAPVRLDALVAEETGAAQWLPELGRIEEPGPARVHALLIALRLPPDRAAALRAAMVDRLDTDDPGLTRLGDTNDHVLVPAGVEGPDADELAIRLPAPGESDTEACDDNWEEPQRHQAKRLGRAVSAMQAMLDIDQSLHVLEPNHGFLALDDPRRAGRYREALQARLDAFLAAPGGSDAAFAAMAELDELMHSILHYPPAHEESWFAKIADAVRAELWKIYADLRQREEDVEMATVSGSAATPQMVETSTLVRSPDRAGEVLVVVRPWRRIGSEVTRARTIVGVDEQATSSSSDRRGTA